MSKRLFPVRRVLWMPLDLEWRPPSAHVTHCCQEMTASLEFDCDQHLDPFKCPDTTLVFHEIFGEYGIPIRDGGAGYLIISNCPFCGSHLSESRRDEWFDATDAPEFAKLSFDKLPERFRTAAWRLPAKS